ncbi:sel1 repeat family protein [Pseudoxanthomonas mexicana]|uniref:sel1 repeat family protein n=1 Tax=Pseudoxanthomonas mexicana TaxID=128785 RepID=UPI00398A82D9
MRISLLLLYLLACPAAIAGENTPPKRNLNPTIDPMLIAAGFLDSHPDLRHRTRGLEEYGDRNFAKAFDEFRRAGWYSDKPSQAIVGEMYWIGLGTVKDRALAYIWMELAAERGYLSFVEKRRMYWQHLDEDERARVQKDAPSLRAEYADEAAEPRLQAALRRERRQMTGSRVGSMANPVQIVVPGVGTIDSSQYYDPKYWEPRLYRQWQDSIWTSLRIGRVSVGEVEQVGDAPSTPPPQNEDQTD